jgi:hypothetical protein
MPIWCSSASRVSSSLRPYFCSISWSPTPWMSRRGFSRQRSLKDLESMVGGGMEGGWRGCGLHGITVGKEVQIVGLYEVLEDMKVEGMSHRRDVRMGEIFKPVYLTFCSVHWIGQFALTWGTSKSPLRRGSTFGPHRDRGAPRLLAEAALLSTHLLLCPSKD